MEIISNCCSAGVYEDTDICMECKEHCDSLSLCQKCGEEYCEEPDDVMCQECITEKYARHKKGPNYVFVYGHEKYGFKNHRILEKEKFLGECRTRDYYSMTQIDTDLVLVHNHPQQTTIKGELYKVSNLALEKLSFLYDTNMSFKREVWIDDFYGGPMAKAWVFFSRKIRGHNKLLTGELNK